ncbi:MAG: restriction endonuclease subunit S, partial [Desulfovibrio sp.]|nr:restriction endonuclease subunit S [Desulfovibrio sp.]
MARPRKNAPKPDTQELSPVPVEEQPYPLPEGWKWVRLGDAASWGSGGTPSRKIPGYYGGTIPWIKTGELLDDYIFSSEEYITEDGLNNSSAKIFPKDTVIIAMYGATIGKTAILGVPSSTNQACACASSFCGKTKYLFYYLQSEKTNFINKAKGGAQPNISQEIIKNSLIPMPPLDVQERIVTHIESLFAKLDEAREKAQAALDSFESRKAAILHKAFTGELTAKWREERGIGKESWSQKTFANLIHKIEAGKNFRCEERPPVDGEVGVVK